MALRSTYSDENKVVNSGLDVTYSSIPTYYTETGVPTVHYWTVTRRSTTSFSYIGMTKAAAEACAADMRSKYTRQYARWFCTTRTNPAGGLPLVDITQGYVTERTSSVQPSPESGDNWRVDVEVDETDEVVSLDELKTVEDFAAYFQLADAREITTGSIAITAAKWHSASHTIDANYTAYITDFDRTKLAVKVWDEESTAWVNPASTTSTVDGSISFMTVVSENKKFKLVYDGTVESQPWTTNDQAEEALTITSGSATWTEQFAQQVGHYYALTYINAIWKFKITSSLSAIDTVTSHYKVAIQGKSYTPSSVDSNGVVVVNTTTILPHSNETISIRHNDVSATAALDILSEYIEIDSGTVVVTAQKDGWTSGTLAFSAFFTSNLDPSTVLSSAKIYYEDTYTGAKRYATGVTVVVDAVESVGGYRINGSGTFTQDPTETFFRIEVGNVYSGYEQKSFVSTMPAIVMQLTGVVADINVVPGSLTLESGATATWDWGDGTVETGITSTPQSHAYAVGGNYTITVKGVGGNVIGLGDCFWSSSTLQYISQVEALTKLYLNPSIRTVGNTAFYRCANIASLSIDGVTSFGSNAFSDEGDTDFVSTIIFPTTATYTFGINGFRGRPSLSLIKFTGKIQSASVFGASVFYGHHSGLVISALANTKAEVQALSGWPFGCASGTRVLCSDGEITMED